MPDRQIVLNEVPRGAGSSDSSDSDDDMRVEFVELGEGARGKVFQGKFASLSCMFCSAAMCCAVMQTSVEVGASAITVRPLERCDVGGEGAALVFFPRWLRS